MSANDHLNPQQFIQEAAGYEKWARSEEKTLRAAHTKTYEDGRSVTHYPTDAGRRMSRLRTSRTMLEDFASQDAYSKMETGKSDGMLAQPLHDLLPEHLHPLVDEYKSTRP